MIYNTIFVGNSAAGGGGAVCASSMRLDLRNCSFSNNTAKIGGGIYFDHDGIENNTFRCNDTTFEYNEAHEKGGAVFNREAEATFIKNYFHNNQAQQGSAVYSHSNVTFTNCKVTNNQVGESTIHCWEASITFNGSNTIQDNVGVLKLYYSDVTFTGVILFINNTHSSGPGGAISSIASTITFGLYNHSRTVIRNNKARRGGGIYLEQSTVFIYGILNITENMGTIGGGGIYALQSTISIGIVSFNLQSYGYTFSGDVSINKNMAEDNGGGVYLSAGSSLSISRVDFIVSGNRAKNYGGGMFLSTTSKIIMEDLSNLTFTSNLAEKGGGMYIADDEEKSACGEGSSCFLQVMLIRSSQKSKLFFGNNTATKTGVSIYGGLLDRCIIIPVAEFTVTQNQFKGLSFLQSVIDFAGKNNTTSFDIYNSVSSDPVRVCFCNGENNIPSCNYTLPTVSKNKGERFTVSLVVLDQVGRPVNATLISSLKIDNGDTGSIEGGQKVRQIADQCTEMEYNVLLPAMIQHNNRSVCRWTV